MKDDITIAGIDFSLTSPGICVYRGNRKKWNGANCTFHFFCARRGMDIKSKNLYPYPYPGWTESIGRFESLARWTTDIVYECSDVMIEGYSFGSTGRVFDIAECCGTMKYKLWQNDIKFSIAPPTVVKKFAVGKGRADKDQMFDAFSDEKLGIDLHQQLNVKTTSKIGSPISDVVDSYFICKLLFTQLLDVNP